MLLCLPLKQVRLLSVLIGASRIRGDMGTQTWARFQHCDAQPQLQQCVDPAASQHVESTTCMVESMCRSRAADRLTVRPAFLHYGWCGPYGIVEAVCQRLLRVHSSRDFRDEYFLELLDDHPQRGGGLHGVERCVAAARPRTQRPSLPASPRSRADEYPPQPSQVARRALPSPPTKGRGSHVGGGTDLRGCSPSPTTPASSAARGRTRSAC